MADPKFVLVPQVGVHLEDPHVIEAVRLFDARNKLSDRVVALHAVVSGVTNKLALSPEIKKFVDERFTKLAIEISERVLDITPRGEPAVRYISVMRQSVEPKLHNQTYYLPKNQTEELHAGEQQLHAREQQHQESSLWKRDLLHSVRRGRAVEDHNERVKAIEAETQETIASFLTTARTHWNDAVFQEYDRKLSEIEELAQMAYDIGLYLNGGVQSRAVKLEAESCELSFKDYVAHPRAEQFELLKRGVEKLHALIDFRPEDITSRVAEWKLRLKRDLSNALEIIEGRQAINPQSLSDSVVDAMREVQQSGTDAVEWLDDIALRVTEVGENQIRPELHQSILKLLSNQKEMMGDPKLKAFYAAIGKLEEAGKPAEPKRLVAAKVEAPPLLEKVRAEVVDGDPFEGQINETEARRLGLERVEILSNCAAQDLLMRAISTSRLKTGKIDISHRSGVDEFISDWNREAPSIPVPCTHDSYGYINALRTGNIIQNLDPNNKIHGYPFFHRSKILWMQDFQEGDWDDKNFEKVTSRLLVEFGLGSKVVNISRKAIDEALWKGDPSLQKKTRTHENIIKQLGLDPRYYTFRLIAQDEYARLAGSGKNFGKNSLWTWFNDYWIGGESVNGLRGGDRDYGGPSNVVSISRGSANEDLAVRLVLECNK